MKSDDTLFVGIAGITLNFALHVGNQLNVAYDLLNKTNVFTFY